MKDIKRQPILRGQTPKRRNVFLRDLKTEGESVCVMCGRSSAVLEEPVSFLHFWGFGSFSLCSCCVYWVGDSRGLYW